jgi:hypothetical protein
MKKNIIAFLLTALVVTFFIGLLYSITNYPDMVDMVGLILLFSVFGVSIIIAIVSLFIGIRNLFD